MAAKHGVCATERGAPRGLVSSRVHQASSRAIRARGGVGAIDRKLPESATQRKQTDGSAGRSREATGTLRYWRPEGAAQAAAVRSVPCGTERHFSHSAPSAAPTSAPYAASVPARRTPAWHSHAPAALRCARLTMAQPPALRTRRCIERGRPPCRVRVRAITVSCLPWVAGEHRADLRCGVLERLQGRAPGALLALGTALNRGPDPPKRAQIKAAVDRYVAAE